jgi:hypothetical protein
MTATINASTSSGVVVTSDTSGSLALQTASTTALTIDSSQNVGIGTTSPVTKVDIQSTTGLAYKAKRTSSGVAGGIGAGATSQGLAIFATDFYANTPIVFGVNQTDTSANPFVGLTERMRINATAPVLCLAGGSTTATGTGIAFPATQNPSSDANTLDDYETGTWSASGITTVNVTGASFSEGRYTKIGNIVHIQGKFTLTVTTANTLTYVVMASPFTPLYSTSGTVMDNSSLVSGTCQITNAGNLYAFFAASASLPAGATLFYVNAQYQV